MSKSSATSQAGDVALRYLSQDPSVILDSVVQSDSGSVEVVHHANFAGSFDLNTELGNLKTANQEGKRVVIGKDRQSVTGGQTLQGQVYTAGSNVDSGSGGSTKVSTETGDVRVTL